MIWKYPVSSSSLSKSAAVMPEVRGEWLWADRQPAQKYAEDNLFCILWSFNTTRELFKWHSLPEDCCWPCPSVYNNRATIFRWLLPAGWRTMLQLRSSCFLNMTMSSLYSNVLHSHQIAFQYLMAPLWCGQTGDLHQCSAANKAATVWR